MKELDIVVLDTPDGDIEMIKITLIDLLAGGHISDDVVSKTSFSLTEELPIEMKGITMCSDAFKRQCKTYMDMDLTTDAQREEIERNVASIPDHITTLVAISSHAVDGCQLALAELLVHECVHAKQIQDGRLAIEDGVVNWEGEKYNHQGTFNAEYFSRPWEQEAYLAQAKYVSALSGMSVKFHMNDYLNQMEK